MYISFRHFGNVVIDDVGKLFNIDTPCSNIGCNQHAGSMLFEIAEGLLPRILRFVPMDGGCPYLRLGQFAYNTVRAVLGARKYQSRFNFRTL